jgi:hypothetical protein
MACDDDKRSMKISRTSQRSSAPTVCILVRGWAVAASRCHRHACGPTGGRYVAKHAFARTECVLPYESTSMTHFNDVRWMVERNVARSLDNDNDGGGGTGARNGWWWWEGICAVCDVANGIRLAVDRMLEDNDPQKMNATQQSTKNNGGRMRR